MYIFATVYAFFMVATLFNGDGVLLLVNLLHI